MLLAGVLRDALCRVGAGGQSFLAIKKGYERDNGVQILAAVGEGKEEWMESCLDPVGGGGVKARGCFPSDLSCLRPESGIDHVTTMIMG